MATNYVQEGCTLTLAAPYNVLSGAGMQVGTLFGVAQYDALITVDVECALEGVFDLAKVSTDAWSQGDTLYWDDSAKLITDTASTNIAIGHATEDRANPTSTGRVLLNHGPQGAAGPGGVPALTVTVALTDGDSGYIVSPVAGDITRIDTVLLGGAVATNDAVLTFKIGAAGAGTPITTGVVTIAFSGSAIGDKDTCAPTAANTVAAGDLIYCTVSGTPGGSRTATASILITP